MTAILQRCIEASQDYKDATMPVSHLSSKHFDMLRNESGIDESVIAERGYRTITNEADLLSIPGFRPNQRRVPGLLMPLFPVSGETGRFMYRPDNPRVIEEDKKERQFDGSYLKKNKVIKYESQTDMPAVMDCPPRCRKDIDDPNVPLYVTEGQKKADAMASHGLCAISLQGVWGFKGTNSKGGKTLLDDWDCIAWNGRDVRIVFDSDVTTKPAVKMAMDSLTAHAEKKGAKVVRVVLPALPSGDKCGVDDYLVTGHTAQDLEALAQSAALQSEAHKPASVPLIADDGAHDEANAQYAAARMRGQFVHVTEIGWMHHTGTHWRSGDAEKAVDRAIVEALKARRVDAVSNPSPYSDAILRAAKPTAKNIANARTLLASILTISIHDLDNDPDVLNCINGVVNLRNGEITPHNEANQQFSYCVPVEYDPKIDVSRVFNFFVQAIKGGAEVVAFLFLMLGYGITGHTSLEKFLYIYGPPRAGKGTLIEMLCELFPLLVGITSFSTLTQRAQDVNDFRLAELRPCRIVIADEGANRMQFDADRIKYLTGGAPVEVAFKHKRAFRYKPQFMPMLVSNNPLQMDVDDEAAWSRPRIVEFAHSHVGDEDPTIKAGLKSRECLQQLLALMVAGSIKFYGSGMRNIPAPECVTLAAQTHRNEADYVSQWLEERCNKSGYILRSQAYGNYKAWCMDAGTHPWGAKRFFASLRAKGFDVPDKTERIDGEVGRFAHGLSMRLEGGL